MTVGTKSVLFGAHQFLLHPLFVAAAWWRLYGFPWDPRLWVAFVVHDLGYLGKPNMDGPEGEAHTFLGAGIMGDLFDDAILCRFRRVARIFNSLFGYEPEFRTWYCFTFFHSRFMAKRYGADVSRLCIADKLATALMPAWLFLPLVNLTGEIHEYMGAALHKEGSKYAEKGLCITGSQREWFDSMRRYLEGWVEAHRDGSKDTWTAEVAR